jgi:DNA (cytosine-5)-methyltransferase 1
MLTFGSLFAACGGIDLGFERAGLTCAWQVEISEFRRRVLAKHWPDVRRHDDVRTFPTEPIDQWRADIIVGGDPCQENSRARITTGTRSPSLGAEFIRIVDILRPSIVVRENPTRVRADAPWPWWRFRSELERLDYAVLPFRLRACCLGAKHQRDRLFLLAEYSNAHSQPDWMRGRAADVSQAGAVQREARERQWVRSDVLPVVCGQALHADSERLERIDGQGESPEHVCRTGGDSRGTEQRNDVLSTSRVCRSRNDVPDYVERVSALGDAVVPAVAEWIGRRILATHAPNRPTNQPSN